MPFDAPTYRSADAADADLLAKFRCSTGLQCEDEVERFVQETAYRLATAQDSHYKLLMFFASDRLFAVAGYHPELLATEVGLTELDSEAPPRMRLEGTLATRLSLVALAHQAQGALSATGARLSDLVMSTLINEAMGSRHRALMTALVAKDNLRSLRLCARHGLRSEVEYDAAHLRVSGLLSRS